MALRKVKETAAWRTVPNWDVSPTEAIQIQQELRSRVRLEPFNKPIRTIGGADISFNRFSTTAYAVFVVLDAKTNECIDRSYFIGELKFPYIPGLLSFREIPLLLEAWNRLKTKPDLLMMDGQGVAHPRRLGIASHFGVLTDFPTIGCGKSRLTGTYLEPPNEAKAFSELKHNQERIGFAYRTKRNTGPIFVSPGHRVDFGSTLKILRAMDFKYRIPEPTRQAHLYANEVRLEFSSSELKIPNSPALQTKKQPFEIEKVLALIRKEVKPFPKAAMFELADRGYTSLFQQLVACIISIRTYDEVSLPAALRLLNRADSPRKIAELSVNEIDELISQSTFHFQKAERILKIAKITLEQFKGKIPEDQKVVLSLPGIGPKCASLALGISCNRAAVSVDVHVQRVTHRWGLIEAKTPDRAALELEKKVSRRDWIELNALLVPFGKHVCTGYRPKCSQCPVLSMCRQVDVKNAG
jgi:endonuclease-3